jgi:hypothetical protein
MSTTDVINNWLEQRPEFSTDFANVCLQICDLINAAPPIKDAGPRLSELKGSERQVASTLVPSTLVQDEDDDSSDPEGIFKKPAAKPVKLRRDLSLDSSDSDTEEDESTKQRKDIWKSYVLLFTTKYRIAHSYNQRARPEGSFTDKEAIERLLKLVTDKETKLCGSLVLPITEVYEKLKSMTIEDKDELLTSLESEHAKKRKAPNTVPRVPKRLLMKPPKRPRRLKIPSSKWITRTRPQDMFELQIEYLNSGGDRDRFDEISQMGLDVDQVRTILHL